MTPLRALLSTVILTCAFACGAPPAPEPSFSTAKAFNPLEACTTTSFGRYARGAACGDTQLLFVSRAASPGDLLQATERSLQAYALPVEPRTLRLGNRDVAALGYHMGPFDSAAVAVLVVPLELYGTSESIEAQCFHFGGPVDPKRCARLLDAFVAQGLTRGEWPKVLPARAAQTSQVLPLPSRQVRLPSACELSAPFDFDCKEGHVRMWTSDDAQQLSRTLAADLRVSADASLAREWSAPCTIEGVPTTCNLRRHRLQFGDELHAYRALVTLAGQPILLACEVKRSTAPQLPGSICGQLFMLSAEALQEPPLPESEE